jgi:hypothetical protein
MCVSNFSTVLSETFLILRRTERDMIKYVHWLTCKVLGKNAPYKSKAGHNAVFLSLVLQAAAQVKML